MIMTYSKKHPFRNFGIILRYCEYRDNWYTCKQEAAEEYVKRELGLKTFLE
jgi:hypothetical protein